MQRYAEHKRACQPLRFPSKLHVEKGMFHQSRCSAGMCWTRPMNRVISAAFIQSDLQLIRLSRRHTPWSNVGLRALLKGPTAVQILSWPHQGSNHQPCGSKSSSLTTTLQAAPRSAKQDMGQERTFRFWSGNLFITFLNPCEIGSCFCYFLMETFMENNQAYLED